MISNLFTVCLDSSVLTLPTFAKISDYTLFSAKDLLFNFFFCTEAEISGSTPQTSMISVPVSTLWSLPEGELG